MKIRWPWQSAKGDAAGRIGVSIGPDGVGVAQVDSAGQPVWCGFYSEAGDGRDLLAKLVEEHGWEGMPCSVVLHPAYYQMLLAESPAVEEAEMITAVQWRIKDLLDFPVEEAAVEYFPLPEDAYRGQKSMLYAAAVRKSMLPSLMEPVLESGLTLDCIEIAELAMHNLNYCLPEVRGGVAVLHLMDGEGFINLVEDGAVYLSRHIDLGLMQIDPDADNTGIYESLLLEIQRSLDFYESQLGKGIISQLYFSPGIERVSEMGEYLATQLALNVEPFDLAKLLSVDESERALQDLSLCGVAVGAALGAGRKPAEADAGDEVEEADFAAH